MTTGSFQTNFSRGQLSDRISTRIDTKAYQDGAGTVSNMLVSLQGGATTRPGSKKRARLENGGVALTGTEVRTEPLSIDRDEAYVLAFTDARLDIYRLTTDDVTLSQSLTGQPWDETSMWFMTVEMYGNIVFVTDQSFQSKVFTRTALDTFTDALFVFQTRIDGNSIYEPYHKFSAYDLTLAFSSYAVGSGVTVTASADVFVSAHVGKRFRVRDGEIEITAYASATSATCQIIREISAILDPNPMATHDSSTTVTCTWVGHGLIAGDTVNFDGCGDSGATITGANIDGDRTVVLVLDEDLFTFVAGGTGSDSVDFGGSDVHVRSAAATRNWKEPAFSDVRGWPQACSVHQGRFWFGGSTGLRDDRWGSVPGNFFSFDQGDGGANDAVKAVGEAGGGNIRHLVSGQDLEVFSDIRESYLPSGDSPITQSNVRGRPQTKYGASYTKPLRFDGSTIFVDGVGQHVREFLSDGDINGTYVAPPVTALSANVISLPYHATVFEGSTTDATPYAIYTNDDGTAAFFHAARAEQLAGWTAQVSGGAYKSFAGVGERLFAGTLRGGEMFLEEWDWGYIARADGCENLTNAGTTSWTATAIYLLSETVDVFDSLGNFLEQTTTDGSGNFSTTDSQTDIWVGLPANWALTTLPPALALRNGPFLGRRHHISEAIVSLISTTRIKIGRTVHTWTSAFTGQRASRKLGWSRGATVPLTGAISDKATVPGIRVEVG